MLSRYWGFESSRRTKTARLFGDPGGGRKFQQCSADRADNIVVVLKKQKQKAEAKNRVDAETNSNGGPWTSWLSDAQQEQHRSTKVRSH